MRTLNPEGSLKIDTSADRDGEVEMVIENPKPSQSQSVYIGKGIALDIIRHLSGVFGIRHVDSSMRCETCRWWLGYGRDLPPIFECTRMAQRDEDDKGECEIGWCGPQFSCDHWEGK